MIKEAIVKIVNKEDLTYNEAYTVMNEIMSGETTPTQNAAFLAALSTKSARAETTDEIAGCAAAMREHAVKVDTDMDIFEIVGTGGDNAHRFQPVRHRRLPRSAGRQHPAKPSPLCGTVERGGNLLLLRTKVPHIDEICGSYPQGAGLPHRVQHSGTPD